MRTCPTSRCWRSAFAAALCVAACHGTTEDPVGITRAFLGAVSRGDCDSAWAHFSRGTQENALAQVRRRKRNMSYAAEPIPTPQTLYCAGSYGDPALRSARLESEDGATAVVSVQFSEGTHLPLIPFLSAPYREWRDTLQLVREDGRWKIDRPRVETGRPGWRLAEVGEVEVAWHLGGDPRREWVEADAVLRAPREALEATLMDPSAWPRFFPLVERVEPLSEPAADGGRDWRLRFRAADGATAATVVRLRPYGRLRDPRLPWTTVQWVVAGDNDRASTPALPLFTGSFKLRERFEGLWATFSLVVQPDEWPPGFAQQFLAETTAASAVTNLEREARSAASRDPAAR